VDLVIQARIDSTQDFKRDIEVTVSHYLDKRLVVFLQVDTQREAFLELVHVLDREKKLLDKGQFFDAILEREKIVSTGIGLGIAIPHAKLEGYHDFFIAIGIQSKKGIDWNALDGAPVRVIFMIGGPGNKQTEYLKILSSLTLAIKNEERRKKILKTKIPQDIIELFHGC
jgi:PTS system nitrogen regulatory IIA component